MEISFMSKQARARALEIQNKYELQCESGRERNAVVLGVGSCGTQELKYKHGHARTLEPGRAAEPKRKNRTVFVCLLV